MLSTLVDIKQTINVYPKKGDSKKDRYMYSLTKLSTEQNKIIDSLNIRKYIMEG